jgi:hypothetical protein
VSNLFRILKNKGKRSAVDSLLFVNGQQSTVDRARIQSRIQKLKAKLHYTTKWLSTIDRQPLTIFFVNSKQTTVHNRGVV